MKTKTLADNQVGHIIQLIAKHSMVASRVSSVGEYGTLTDGDMSGQFLPAVSSKLKFILQIKLCLRYSTNFQSHHTMTLISTFEGYIFSSRRPKWQAGVFCLTTD